MPAHTGSPRPGTPLSALRRGDRGRIVALSHERGQQLARRLSDLGLEPGREVTVGRRAPLGDPTVYRVADYEISLRRQDAALVLVEPAGGPEDLKTPKAPEEARA